MGNSIGNIHNDTPQACYERIKELYNKDGLSATNEYIATDLHVNTSTVSRWKTRFPGVDVLMKISRRFNVSIGWLVQGEEIGPNGNVQGDMKIEDICGLFQQISTFSDIKITNMKEIGIYRNAPPGTPVTINLSITPIRFTEEKDNEKYFCLTNYILGNAFIFQQYLLNMAILKSSGLSDELKEKLITPILNEIIKNTRKSEDEDGFLINTENPHGTEEKKYPLSTDIQYNL